MTLDSGTQAGPTGNDPTDNSNPEITLAELVTTNPPAARVLESHLLDYCCGGGQTLAEACGRAGLDPTAVLAEIDAREPVAQPDWASMGPAELVDHLEATHHAYLHTEMPRLTALVDKVSGVHGERHPELEMVRVTYDELRDDMEPHLLKEERVLFPMVRQLAAARAEGRPTPTFHCGTLRNPIGVMLMEHDRVGELLGRLRSLTSGYAPPEDACASYRALYTALAELEEDTHLHVHKENNVLFPAVTALES